MSPVLHPPDVPEALTRSIVESVKRHLSLRHFRIFYFGSRVRGTETPRSDYDVGVEADGKIPLAVLARIRDDLDEIPILQKIDLVDFASVSSEFSSQAKEVTHVIHEQ